MLKQEPILFSQSKSNYPELSADSVDELSIEKTNSVKTLSSVCLPARMQNKLIIKKISLQYMSVWPLPD